MKNKHVEQAHYAGIPKLEMIQRYLEGRLSAEERRAFEELFTEDEFSGDAIEALKEMNDPAEIERIQSRLQHTIRKKTEGKLRMKRKTLFFPGWLITAVLILLMIMLAGYVIIRMLAQ